MFISIVFIQKEIQVYFLYISLFPYKNMSFTWILIIILYQKIKSTRFIFERDYQKFKIIAN